jgi:hypothetical protein
LAELAGNENWPEGSASFFVRMKDRNSYRLLKVTVAQKPTHYARA